MKNEFKPHFCPFCGVKMEIRWNEGGVALSCPQVEIHGSRIHNSIDELLAEWKCRPDPWRSELPDEPGCYLYSRKGKIGMVVLVQRRFGLRVVTEFEEYEMDDFRKEYKPEKWFKIMKPEEE